MFTVVHVLGFLFILVMLAQFAVKKGRKVMSKGWTVWVGGVEVNDFYLHKKEAFELATVWKNRGYDDVCVEYVSKEKR